MNSIVLNKWQWREASADKNWNQCTHDNAVTEIYTDLLDAGLVPDPFVDRNELDVQWVAKKDWEYKCEFTVDDLNKTFHDMVFEGLDTIATVYLNDKEILKSDNMFHIHRVPVELKEGQNELRILFQSALEHGYELAGEKGHLVVSNGDDTRAYVRKAQYHYGWDWGPVLMTCGPYKEVKVESYDSNITNVFVDANVYEDLSANVDVSFDLKTKKDAVAKVQLIAPGGKELVSKEAEVSTNETAKVSFKLDKPELWYPINYGNQDRYTIKIITDNQTIKKMVGLRRVELIQHKFQDQSGSSFFFKINNIPIFCYGSNWIPGHNFLTKLSPEDYNIWLQRAVDCNQNMIRIWGGGIYEPDNFYEQCDKLGLMVWQDFMFACGQYPYYPEFRQSICREIQDQLKRLRNFCSIVIYAGNNEDYQIAEESNLDYDPNDHSGDYTKTGFPARTAYETDMPYYVDKLTSRVPYHPGSPWGGKSSGDSTVGDNHQWNVWHGTQEKYQDWAKLACRFVSEFGMLAYPHRSTIDKCISDPTERYPQSITMDSHCKATGFERRLALYVMENIKVESMDLDSWIYATQLMQSECLAYAYRCWRREWRGEGKEYVAGALVWQLNDCWPVSSWAIVDFYGNKKLSYYAIKRECSAVNVGIYRTDKVFDVWGVNSNLKNVYGLLELKAWDIKTGRLVKTWDCKKVCLLANQTTEFYKDLGIDDMIDNVVVMVKLTDIGTGELLCSRVGDWPQPLKYLKMPDRQLKVDVFDNKAALKADKPVKGVRLSINDPHHSDLLVDWQDNGVDVFPNEVVEINAPGLKKGDKVTVEYYQM